MKSRGKSTYRLTLEVDKWITKESERLGVSKNAFVQMILRNVMKEAANGNTQRL